MRSKKLLNSQLCLRFHWKLNVNYELIFNSVTESVTERNCKDKSLNTIVFIYCDFEHFSTKFSKNHLLSKENFIAFAKTNLHLRELNLKLIHQLL